MTATTSPLRSPPRSPPWRPHVFADRRPFLVARNRVSAAVRQWFDAQDFLEAETPILQVSPGNEAHLEAFATDLVGPDAETRRLYLHTSPEFAMKKLLAAGEPRLFHLGAGLPQSRAQRDASSRIHDARVVSRA